MAITWYEYNPLLPIQHYLDSEGHDTGKPMRFTDMCIEIDNNYKYKLGVDQNRIINMLYSIAFMLACKKQYFYNTKDYDAFAWDIALELWDRLEHPRNPDAPIKSCLNYMKGIIGFRKISFLEHKNPDTGILLTTRSKTIGDPVWRQSYLDQYASSQYSATLHEHRRGMLEDLLNELPRKILEIMPKNVPKYYQNDLIISVILSVTYSNSICYNIPDTYYTVVQMLTNEIRQWMQDETHDIISSNTPDDSLLEILKNGLWEDNDDNNVYNE